jgi:LmbE family N-acetylglucosaminyl deacetylase
MRELVVSVHPDDETLGCGGTILRRVAEGRSVSWAIVTRAHSPLWSEAVVEAKSREIDAVAAAYEVASVHRLGFPSTSLDTVPRSELITALRTVVDDVRPEVVYVTHPGDAHAEHAITFEALTAVLRAFRMRSLGVRRVLAYETLSSTDAAPALPGRAFIPQVSVDITDYLERKLEVMNLYETEAQSDPLPRGPSAIRALARTRGAAVGVEYAEAFVVVRELD